MSDGEPLGGKETRWMLNLELSEKEIFLIGGIVAYWGFLEHEIFMQTVATFDEGVELPHAMNNIQFTAVLDLWEARVLPAASDEAHDVLSKQLARIRALQKYRTALVHSMWEWDATDLEKITATRVVKKEVISTTFTASDLQDFFESMGEICFRVRYPRDEDRADHMMEVGGYFSRDFLKMISCETPIDAAGSAERDKDAT